MQNSSERQGAISAALNQIDLDHAALFEVAEAVIVLATNNAAPDPGVAHMARLSEEIARLEREAKQHIERESQYMRLYGYKGVESHDQLHEAFTAAIESLRATVSEEGLSPSAQERAKSINEWLRGHLRNDEDFLRFLSDSAKSVSD